MSLRSLTHILTVRTERGTSVLDAWQEGWFSSPENPSFPQEAVMKKKPCIFGTRISGCYLENVAWLKVLTSCFKQSSDVQGQQKACRL